MSTRNNMHSDSGLLTYAKGMCNSSSDKARINEYLVPGTILELGCGNGAYLQTLPNARLAQTTAVDMNAHLLQMAADNVGDKGVVFMRRNILNMPYEGIMAYDNVVLCSVMHELYSELRAEFIKTSNEGVAHVQAHQAIGRFIKDLANNLLRPGGRLIIRDGVKPQDTAWVCLNFNNEDGLRAKFAKFVDEHPWFMKYDEHNGDILLSPADLFEFLSKYIYDVNWDIEVLERFGWATTGEVWNWTTQTDLETVSLNTYLIPWLREQWERDFTITKVVEGQRIPYLPDSTMISVFENVR